MSRRGRRAGGGLAGLLALVVLAVVLIGSARHGGTGGQPASSSASASASASSGSSGTASVSPPPGGPGHVPAGTLDPAVAAAALGTLPVAARGSLAGYERSCADGAGCVFGPAWADVDHNGCDQRNDVLRRDLTGVETRAGTHGCVVVAGALLDPYTGHTVQFVKADAAEVPIDHVVPLAAAWTQGAAAWTSQRREEFANDVGNLIATTREQNSAKGDSTAEEWVPANGAFDCAYASVVVTVKQRYGLSVTPAEADALRRLLAAC